MAEYGQPLIVRLMEKVEVTDTCWNWTGAKSRDGYGQFGIDGKSKRAHRASYELFKGKIPKGLVIHHQCSNTFCINPAHLEAVTQKVNIQVGLTGNYNIIKTQCPQGHEYTPDNLCKQSGGRNWRQCRTCRNSQKRIAREKLKASI